MPWSIMLVPVGFGVGSTSVGIVHAQEHNTRITNNAKEA